MITVATPSATATRTVKPFSRAQYSVNRCDCLLGTTGCSPSFSYPSNTVGTCTQGTYNGCPCEKCGGGSGYVGSCSNNGCNGVSGKCTSGNYDGCPCN
ncbi:hypothetical protein V8E55_011610 [Tylopilus felleus]